MVAWFFSSPLFRPQKTSAETVQRWRTKLLLSGAVRFAQLMLTHTPDATHASFMCHCLTSNKCWTKPMNQWWLLKPWIIQWVFVLVKMFLRSFHTFLFSSWRLPNLQSSLFPDCFTNVQPPISDISAFGAPPFEKILSGWCERTQNQNHLQFGTWIVYFLIFVINHWTWPGKSIVSHVLYRVRALAHRKASRTRKQRPSLIAQF